MNLGPRRYGVKNAGFLVGAKRATVIEILLPPHQALKQRHKAHPETESNVPQAGAAIDDDSYVCFEKAEQVPQTVPHINGEVLLITAGAPHDVAEQFKLVHVSFNLSDYLSRGDQLVIEY